MKWIKGLRIQARVPDRQRGCAGTQGICECTCACESRECRVCAFTSELLSLAAKEEEGDLAAYIHVLY